MHRELPTRFWFEAVVAALGIALFVLTLITRERFEALTGIDPDGGSGALEFGLAAGVFAIAVISALAARRTYRRATATA